MRRLVRQIKCELKTAKHCAIYQGNSAASGPTTGISVSQKLRDLLRIMVFACGFIVTVCAPFSIERQSARENPRLAHQNEVGSSGSGWRISRICGPVAGRRQAMPDEDSAGLGSRDR